MSRTPSWLASTPYRPNVAGLNWNGPTAPDPSRLATQPSGEALDSTWWRARSRWSLTPYSAAASPYQPARAGASTGFSDAEVLSPRRRDEARIGVESARLSPGHVASSTLGASRSSTDAKSTRPSSDAPAGSARTASVQTSRRREA